MFYVTLCACSAMARRKHSVWIGGLVLSSLSTFQQYDADLGTGSLARRASTSSALGLMLPVMAVDLGACRSGRSLKPRGGGGWGAERDPSSLAWPRGGAMVSSASLLPPFSAAERRERDRSTPMATLV